MKKNKFMKIASGLLVLCLMTTCVIGATLAKYVTAKEVSDQARVAKWGVRISAVTDSAFETTYAADDGALGGGGALSVKSSTTENVVAPGTKGSAAQFTITGTPEVAVLVSFSMNVEKDVKINAGDYKYENGKVVHVGTNYTPVEFTLKKGETTLAVGTLATIKAYLENHPVICPVETNLAEAIGGYTLEWAWNFGGDDVADTLLGDLAHNAANIKNSDDDTALTAGTEYCTEISYTLTITATQID